MMNHTLEEKISEMSDEIIKDKELMEKEAQEIKEVKEEIEKQIPKLNRAQRRAQQKAEAKRQREIKKMINRYIAKHPEAVQVELDEEKISDLEKEEANIDEN